MRSLVLLLLLSCTGLVTAEDPADGGSDAGHSEFDAGRDAGTSSEPDAEVADAGVVDAGFDAGSLVDAGTDAGTVVDAGTDAGVPTDAGNDPCGGAKLCERWDGYSATTLSNSSNLGSWRVNAPGPGITASLDTARSRSGKALKVHMDQGSASGAQLRISSGPLFAMTRSQLYGRLWLYMGADGSSTHWTIFGAAGTIPGGVPTSGNRATYLFSAFQDGSQKNIFGDVYYNDQTRQDCWNASSQRIPTNRWACVSFFIDGQAMRYRFSLDGAAVPSMNVDMTGQGCVAHPANSPWYGPAFSEFYVGAMSFHPMTAPMDLWIDDVAVDTVPLSCP